MKNDFSRVPASEGFHNGEGIVKRKVYIRNLGVTATHYAFQRFTPLRTTIKEWQKSIRNSQRLGNHLISQRVNT